MIALAMPINSIDIPTPIIPMKIPVIKYCWQSFYDHTKIYLVIKSFYGDVRVRDRVIVTFC
jgi:hypothetical protein